jgi:hypothetical protein
MDSVYTIADFRDLFWSLDHAHLVDDESPGLTVPVMLRYEASMFLVFFCWILRILRMTETILLHIRDISYIRDSRYLL